jgi:hypothetical protein
MVKQIHRRIQPVVVEQHACSRPNLSLHDTDYGWDGMRRNPDGGSRCDPKIIS